MSYRVEYDSQWKKEERTDSWGMRRVAMVCFFLFVFCLVVNLFWVQGRQLLLQVLVPGDAVVTLAHLEQLAQNLHQGTSVQTAVMEFCDGILQGCY